MNKVPTHLDKIVEELLSLDINGEFPFDEVRDKDGNYFNSIDECRAAGYADNQIWSVAITDDADSTTITHGPPHHIVNVEGYVCTEVEHNHRVYYHDKIIHEDYD